MTKVLNSNIYTIHGWMLNELKLKGVELNVYAIVYSFSQDGESEFYGSRKYLCDFIGVSKPTIDKALNELLAKGYITKKSEKRNDVTFNRYKVNLECLNFATSKETLSGVVKELDWGGGKETLPNNKNNNIYNNYIEDIEYIVGFLNEKADVHYKPTTKETQQKIIKLLKQGFDKRDFEQVITTMVTEWKGTDMEKYLRPETLFGNKFESYLNRNVKKTVGKSGYTREELEEIDKRCGVYV